VWNSRIAGQQLTLGLYLVKLGMPLPLDVRLKLRYSFIRHFRVHSEQFVHCPCPPACYKVFQRRRRFMRDTYAMQDTEISVVGAFVAGVTVGVIAGLLFAPRAGPDIRKSLQDYAAHAMSDILET